MSKSVRHAKRAVQRGFTQVPNVVLLDPDLPMGAKFTYALMLHFAWAGEDEWPGQKDLANRMGISPRSLGSYLDALKAGTAECGVLLESIRRGQGLPNAYVVHDPDPERQILPNKNGNDCASGTADIADSLNDGEKTTIEVEVAEATSTSQKTPPTPKGEPRVKFDGKQVPTDELLVAEGTLETFNRLAGTHYQPYGVNGRPTDGLRRILGALLSLPGITAEIAERMIRVQLASPYWGGAKAKPGHVFGAGVREGNFEAASWSPDGAGAGSARGIVEHLDARRAAA